MPEKDDLDSAVSICIQQASEIDINRNKDQIVNHNLCSFSTSSPD